MSLPINLLITTLLIYVVGAFISLAVRRNEQLSINISGVTGVLAGVLGIVACIPVLISSDIKSLMFLNPIWICLIFHPYWWIGGVYGVCNFFISYCDRTFILFSYVKEYKGKGAGSMGFFMNLFIASMVALVTSDNCVLLPCILWNDVIGILFLSPYRTRWQCRKCRLALFLYCACRFGINYDRLLHFLLLCR